MGNTQSACSYVSTTTDGLESAYEREREDYSTERIQQGRKYFRDRC